MGATVITGPTGIPADGSITLAKLADLAQSTFMGRAVGAGSGMPQALTATQATAILDSYSGSTKGLVPAGAGSTSKFLREDGTWSAATAGAGAITPVLSMAVTGSSNVHTVNLSTLGDLDWVFLGNMSTSLIPPRNAISSANLLPQKKTGYGWLLNGIDYCFGGYTLSTNVLVSSWRTIQTTAADGTQTTAINTLNEIGMHTPSGGTSQVGWGFRIAIPAPADDIQRVLRIYTSHFSSVVTYSAVLTDGSTTVSSTTLDSVVSTHIDSLCAVTYKAKYGGWLVVNLLISTCRSAGANIRIAGASLGTA